MGENPQAPEGGLLGRAKRLADDALAYARSDETKAKLAEARTKAVEVGAAASVRARDLARKAGRVANEARDQIDEFSKSEKAREIRSQARASWDRSKGVKVWGVPWTEAPTVIALLLFFFFPLGFWLVWRHPDWSKGRKVAWTSGWAAMMALALATQNPTPTSTEKSSGLEVRIPDDSAPKEKGGVREASESQSAEKTLSQPLSSPRPKTSGAEWGFLAGLSSGDYEEHQREGWLAETGDSVSITSRTGRAALFQTEHWLDVASGEEQKPDAYFEQFCVFVPCPARAFVQKVQFYTIEIIIADGPYEGRRGWLKKKGLRFIVDRTQGGEADHRLARLNSEPSPKRQPTAGRDSKDKSGELQPDDHAKLTAWRAVLRSHRTPPPPLHRDFSHKELQKSMADLRAWSSETVRLYKIFAEIPFDGSKNPEDAKQIIDDYRSLADSDPLAKAARNEIAKIYGQYFER